MNNTEKPNFITRLSSNDRLYPVLLFTVLGMWLMPFVAISLILGFYGVPPVIASVPTVIAVAYLIYKGFKG